MLYIFLCSVPLQSCCCPVQTNLPRKAELARQVSRYFNIIFKSKMLISTLTYRINSSWCVRLQSLIYFDKNFVALFFKHLFFSYFQADRHADRGLGHHPPHTTSSGASPATMAANQRLTLHRNPNQPHIYK